MIKNFFVQHFSEYEPPESDRKAKRMIDKGSTALPTFSQNHCTRSFIKMFSAVLPCKNFTIPQWIPSLNQPSFPFDQSTPSYAKIYSGYSKNFSSSSPCPFDNICFKKMPISDKIFDRGYSHCLESQKRVKFLCIKKAVMIILWVIMKRIRKVIRPEILQVPCGFVTDAGTRNAIFMIKF